MVRFSTEVQTVHFIPELHQVLQHAACWSRIARVDVVVSSIDADDAPRTIGTMLGRSLALVLTTPGANPTDLEELRDHMRRELTPQFGVVLQEARVLVNWDVRRRGIQRATS